MGRLEIAFVGVAALVSVTEGCTSKLVKEGVETTAAPAPATTTSNKSIPCANASSFTRSRAPNKVTCIHLQAYLCHREPGVHPSSTAPASYGSSA